MHRSIFSNLFGTKKKPKDDDEDIKPPERRLSISKSGRMKETKARRQTLTDGFFPADTNKKDNISPNVSQTQPDNANIKKHSKKPSLQEELNIDDIIKELEETAL